jgi:hypothetical protein
VLDVAKRNVAYSKHALLWPDIKSAVGRSNNNYIDRRNDDMQQWELANFCVLGCCRFIWFKFSLHPLQQLKDKTSVMSYTVSDPSIPAFTCADL